MFELAQRAAGAEGFPGAAEEDDVVRVPGDVIVVLPGGDPAVEGAVDHIQPVDFSDGKTFFPQRIVIGHRAGEERPIQGPMARRTIDVKSHAMFAAGAGEGAVVDLQSVGGAIDGLAADEAKGSVGDPHVVGPGVEKDCGIERRGGRRRVALWRRRCLIEGTAVNISSDGRRGAFSWITTVETHGDASRDHVQSGKFAAITADDDAGGCAGRGRDGDGVSRTDERDSIGVDRGRSGQYIARAWSKQDALPRFRGSENRA